MSRRALVLCALPLLMPVGAGAAPADCNDALNETQLMACARAEFTAAEARVVEALARNRADLGPAGAAKLEQAQAAWTAWRDAECAWNAYDPDRGHPDPLILESCRAEMTLGRADDLDAGLSLIP